MPQLLYPFICQWCLGCFHVLAIVKSAAVDMGYMCLLELRWARATLLCSVEASHCGVFSCCRTQILCMGASVVALHGLSGHTLGFYSTGSVAVTPAACGIFLDRTCVPYIGRQIPIHCTTREVPRWKAFIHRRGWKNKVSNSEWIFFFFFLAKSSSFWGCHLSSRQITSLELTK